MNSLTPVTTNLVVLVVAQVLGHLLIQGGLDHGLGQRLEQPVGPCQRDTLERAWRTSSRAVSSSSSEGWGDVSFEGGLMSISFPVVDPFQPIRSSACRATYTA